MKKTNISTRVRSIKNSKDNSRITFIIDIGSTISDWRRLKVRRLSPWVYIFLSLDQELIFRIGQKSPLSQGGFISRIDLDFPGAVGLMVGEIEVEPSPPLVIYIYSTDYKSLSWIAADMDPGQSNFRASPSLTESQSRSM